MQKDRHHYRQNNPISNWGSKISENEKWGKSSASLITQTDADKIVAQTNQVQGDENAVAGAKNGPQVIDVEKKTDIDAAKNGVQNVEMENQINTKTNPVAESPSNSKMESVQVNVNEEAASSSEIGSSSMGNERVLDTFEVARQSEERLQNQGQSDDALIVKGINPTNELATFNNLALIELGCNKRSNVEVNQAISSNDALIEEGELNHNEFVEDNIKISVGDGKSIRFWIDEWVDGKKLSTLFPGIFRAITNKEESLAEVWQRKEEQFGWEFEFRRNLFLWELEELDIMSLMLNDSMAASLISGHCIAATDGNLGMIAAGVVHCSVKFGAAGADYCCDIGVVL
ncbi:hypothetical protein Vadar_029549 [Vaccinium darrowii]|uniref:Uncharacterized protein n=1 Tax=Vaccinium darrowii TaxID=229202 RepID=A0ACB7XD62_9ERIC|nr:hypothetical protein Vadar_029549 [Vaccinium darrowii]